MTLTLIPPDPGLIVGINRVATESIVSALSSNGLPNCFVKPPNDVFYKIRKIAGVLLDASIKGNKSVAYLGVGVNINNDPTSIAEISELATSFRAETGRTTDVIEFATTFIELFDYEYSLAIDSQEF